jgi:hypothetical protein
MPATNLTELFDFEGQFEQAMQAILVANGITAYISEQTVKLPLLNTGIGFDVSPALDVLTDIPKPTNWPADTAPPQEYFRYTGTLEFRVEVPRDENGASVTGVNTMMSQVRATIRAAMMRCCAPFTATNLPYYEIGDIKPNGTTSGRASNGVRNVDFCSLRFVVTFEIRPTAWPAWVEE